MIAFGAQALTAAPLQSSLNLTYVPAGDAPSVIVTMPHARIQKDAACKCSGNFDSESRAKCCYRNRRSEAADLQLFGFVLAETYQA